MTKRTKKRIYYKLEQMHKHLTDEGKELMRHLVIDIGLHELDAIELILEQHADLVRPSMAAYLKKHT